MSSDSTRRRERARTRQQYHRVDGLGDVVVRAGFEADHLVDVGVARREDQDRAIEGLAQLAADRQAVYAGQHQVEQHNTRFNVGEMCQCTVAA